MRAAALTAAARIDPENFLIVVSALPTDADWSVRAALATVLGGLDPERVRGAVAALVADSDVRVQAPALEALAKLGAPDLDARIAAALASFFVSATLPAAPAPDGPYRAGAAAVDITPTSFPVRVNGGFLEKTATQAHDRLKARALVIGNGHERVAICVVDTCMLPRELIDAAKTAAAAPESR